MNTNDLKKSLQIIGTLLIAIGIVGLISRRPIIEFLGVEFLLTISLMFGIITFVTASIVLKK